MPTRFRLVLCGLLVSCCAAVAAPSPSTETVEQALCRLIQTSAKDQRIPVELFTRLIWQESSFRTGAVSRAGAQGVAQFMPGTARERGLVDPFDPEQAIPKAAELIADLAARFGNLGLAAAAYNGGPGRVASWLAGQGGLPAETRHYVHVITGRPVEEWSADLKIDGKTEGDAEDGTAPRTCLQVVATLRKPGRGGPPEAPFAPWGVQLAGNFSKERALASFMRASRAYASVLGETRPMIIGTRLRHRGTRVFYRVRVPAMTRSAANELCEKIRTAGGSCVTLPS